MPARRAPESWEDVTAFALARPGTKWRVEKRDVPPPAAAGMHEGRGLPMGQVQDWRKQLPGGSGLHVQDMGDHYSVHVDRFDPGHAPLEHIVMDAPYVAASVAIVTLVGRRTRLGWLGSALLGYGVGLLITRNDVRPEGG